MIRYECERCGKCCQWPGEVVISEKEIRAMAEDLDISPFDFTQKHTQIRASRNGLIEIRSRNPAFGPEITLHNTGR